MATNINKDKNKGQNKKSNADEKEEEIIFKIITLGDSGVGKTSIINRYIKGKFSDNITSNLGVNFSYKNLTFNKTQKIMLKLYDTCGQEKYRALVKSYYKNADGVLFIFGLDDKESFDHLKDWMERFNEECKIENIPKVLVGNKCDLEIDKELDENLIKEFAKENKIEYIKASAKDDENINALFEELGKMIYKKGLPLDNQEKLIIISGSDQPKKSKKCFFCQIDL